MGFIIGAAMVLAVSIIVISFIVMNRKKTKEDINGMGK